MLSQLLGNTEVTELISNASAIFSKLGAAFHGLAAHRDQPDAHLPDAQHNGERRSTGLLHILGREAEPIAVAGEKIK